MIFKPKIKKVLQLLSISAIALFTALTINTLQTYADDAYTKWAKSIVDSEGYSTAGGTDKVRFGVSYQRTGYLCYLLDKNGNAVPGTNAIALKSPGFSFYNDGANIKWIIHSRKGDYATDQFNGTADWGVTPWNPPASEGGPCTTNEPQIRDYFETVGSDSVQNAAKFVQDNWKSKDITLKFGQGEYYLVIETLMHFKFSDKSTGESTPPLSEVEQKAELDKLLAKVRLRTNPDLMTEALSYGLTDAYNIWKKDMTLYAETGDKSWLNLALTMADMTRNYLEFAIKQEFKKAMEGYTAEAGKWVPVGDFVVGTIPNLIKYKHNLSPTKNLLVFDSYLNKVAPFAEMIQPGNVGETILKFKAWTGSTGAQISDTDVENHGLAMIVISATNPVQTTCDEPKQPTPHPAPNESTGTCTIIKNYRTKIEDTFTDDGCKVTSNLGNEILIETENLYQVVGWATSSSQSEIPSATWPVPSPINKGTTPTTVTLDETIGEKTLYVLLEKTDTPTPEPQDYNYKLTESTITRRIFFSEPDDPLTNMDNESEQVESQTFKWRIPAHRTSCPGNHPFTDECEGHDHTSDCSVKCSTTCTKTHPDTGGKHIAESCTDPHYCGQRCTTQYAKCSYGEWHEKNLKLEGFISSIHHIKLTYINQKQNKSK